MISWLRRKKKSVSLSAAKAEYIAACSTFSEVVWLRKLLERLFDIEMDAVDIYCDNQSCIKFTENPMFHDKSNNIDIKYHYIRDMVQRGAMKLQYVPTEEQVVDVLTKILSRVKFEHFQYKIGVV